MICSDSLNFDISWPNTFYIGICYPAAFKMTLLLVHNQPGRERRGGKIKLPEWRGVIDFEWTRKDGEPQIV